MGKYYHMNRLYLTCCLMFTTLLNVPVLLTAQNSVVDERDGSTYTTVVLNGNQWISQAIRWKCDQSYCCFDSLQLCEKYGRLYSWKAAQKACPAGYILPSAKDFQSLKSVFGSQVNFEKALAKEWLIKPAGHKTSFGVYYDYDMYAHFWTRDGNGLHATAFEINFLSYRTYISDFGKDVSLSVICIKDKK